MPGPQTFLGDIDPGDQRSIELALVRLDGAMVAMNTSYQNASQSNTSALAEVRGEIRRLSEGIDGLKPLAQRSVDVGESISRIWHRIEDMESKRIVNRDEINDRVDKMRSKFDKISFIALGFSIAASLMSGFVYKTYSDNEAMKEHRMQSNEDNISTLSRTISQIEIWLAGDPNRPYKR